MDRRLAAPRGLAIAFLVIGTVTAGAIGYWQWTNTPTYALRQLSIALARHDRQAFMRYVDIDTVSSRFIDDVAAYSLDQARNQRGADALGAVFAAGIIQVMRPHIVDVIREQAIRWVEGANIEGESQSAASAPEVRWLNDLAVKSGAFRNLRVNVSYLRREANVAHVGIVIHSEKGSTDVPLDLLMRSFGHSWQVAEVSNATELFSALGGPQTSASPPQGQGQPQGRANAEPSAPLLAWADGEPYAGRVPLTVQFKADTEGGEPPLTFTWNFGDGSLGSNEAAPCHKYRKPGTYRADLSVSDSRGDGDTDYVEIEVR